MKKIKAFGICLYKAPKKENIEILLCKSVQSKEKWGLLKGVQENGESDQETASREFYEESSIQVNIKDFEKYFEQINIDKDIGIWLVNYKSIHSHYQEFFINNSLKSNYLSWENSKVKFFDIKELPPIKKKQILLIQKIKGYFENTHQFH